MTTEYITMTEDAIDADAIRRAGDIIRAGGLVAFPTETVYGLGGDALNPASSEKIYAAKGRPSDNPLIVHVCSLADIPPIIQEPPLDWRRLAEAFWPGPLTLIFPKSGRVPYKTTGGLDTVAVRFPSHRIAQALIRASGGYIAAPSANRSGRPSPTTAKYCREDLDGRIEMIIDGGQVGIGLESTIIDLTGSEPMILRPGYVTQEMLQNVVGKVNIDRAIISDDSGIRPKAPGMKYRHYAPKGDLTIVQGECTAAGNMESTADSNKKIAAARNAVSEYILQAVKDAAALGLRTGVLCVDETAGRYTGTADLVLSAGPAGDPEENARRLFGILRAFDDDGIQMIWSESFPEDGIGSALMNRLRKAAGQKVVKITQETV